MRQVCEEKTVMAGVLTGVMLSQRGLSPPHPQHRL